MLKIVINFNMASVNLNDLSPDNQFLGIADYILAGGSEGQLLRKNSSEEYDASWESVILYGTGVPPSPVGFKTGTIYLRYSA